MSSDFSEKFSEQGFWAKVRTSAARMGRAGIEHALAMFQALKDADTPIRAKAIIVGALGYFVMPLDLIPDLTPVVGFTDDLGVLASAYLAVALHIKPEHRAWAEARMKSFGF